MSEPGRQGRCSLLKGRERKPEMQARSLERPAKACRRPGPDATQARVREVWRPGEQAPSVQARHSQRVSPRCRGKEMQGRQEHFEQRSDARLEWEADAKGTGNKRTDWIHEN